MGLPDNYLHTLTPAGLISWVSTVTLAQISLMTTAELVRIGWYNNPVVDILYSMTSAGVWVLRVTSEGKPMVTEDQSSNLVRFARLGAEPMVSPNIPPDSNAIQWTLAAVSFTSNAGGSIDTDPELAPALAGYFGIVELLAIVGDSAETPVFEIQEGSTGLPNKQSPGVLVANVSKAFDYNRLWNGTDGTAISIDGSDCTDLGNTVTFTIYFRYRYET
jgi:hypothetical protein